MANFRSLTIQAGTTTQIQDANSLIVGAGVTTSSGNISISSAGGTTNLLDAISIAANKGITASAGTGAFDLHLATGIMSTPTGQFTFYGNLATNGNQNFNWSGTGSFATPSGLTTIAGTTTFSHAGTALTVTNDATVTGVLTSTGGIKANGGVDRSSAATLALGGTTANKVEIGRSTFLTEIMGDLTVDGVFKIGSVEIDPSAPTNDYVLAYNGTKFVPTSVSSLAVSAYSTIDNAGTPVTQRDTIDLPAGTGLVATDNGGNSTTELTIDQSFSPTWTGNHTFNNTINFGADLIAAPGLDHTISVAQAGSGNGNSLTIKSGSAATGSDGDGADLVLRSGDWDGTGNAGNIIIQPGDGTVPGAVNIATDWGAVNIGSSSYTVTVAASTLDVQGNLFTSTLDTAGASTLNIGANNQVGMNIGRSGQLIHFASFTQFDSYNDFVGISAPSAPTSSDIGRLYYKSTDAGFFYKINAGTEFKLATGTGTVTGNNTGDQTIALSGDASGSGTSGITVSAVKASSLKSATTVIDVVSATAPTSGQVLTATSGTAATWQTPASAPVGANPTTDVTLTPFSGSATTFMRSDAAPALSQGISPTWSGNHVFTQILSADGGVDRSTNATLELGVNNATQVNIAQNNVPTVVAGSLTVNQDLIVNGTTTTVNSTTVDIADRLIHLNFAPVGSVGTPSAIAGIDIDRGDDGVNFRDAAALLWDETNSRWNFAFNTQADESSIGADLAVKMGNAIISNNITTPSTVGLNITADATSTWSTTTGDLGIDAAGTLNIGGATPTVQLGVGASNTVAIGGSLTTNTTISAGSGNMVFNFASGVMDFQGNGTSALQINSSATSIAVQSGATLSAASGGQIDLPLQFAINGTQVAALFTAVNASTLVDGSNADALHTHSGLTATKALNEVSTGLTLTGISTAGLSGYMSANNTLQKTDATVVSTGRWYGTYDGVSGEVKTSGEVTVQMTTDGGSPNPGDPVFVALAADDTNTGAGKCTATAPSASGQTLMRVGYVRDNSGYAGSKTCVIKLAPGELVQL